MVQRICPKCGVQAEPRLKFCRECGARVDAAAAADEPTSMVEPLPGPGDVTIQGSDLAVPASPPPPPATRKQQPSPPTQSAPDPEEADEPVSPPKGRLAGSGDETIISGLAARTVAARGAAEGKGSTGDKTIISGAFRAMDPPPALPGAGSPAPAPAAPEPADGIPEELQRTFLGTSIPGTKAPPPPAEIPEELQRTLLGTSVPGKAAPPPPAEIPEELQRTLLGTSVPGKAAPPPPPPPPRTRDTTPITPGGDAGEMTVHDDLGVGDDGEDEPAPDARRSGTGTATHARPSTAPPPAPPTPGPPPPLVEGTPKLEHWSPRVKGDVVTLEGVAKAEGVLVGRDRGDLQYPEDSCLSKKHGRFFRDGEGKLCVEDLGTLNGVYVRLGGPVKLEHRDVLVVGRHAFRFELLEYVEKDDRTIEGDPLTRVQGIQGTAPRARLVKRQEEGFRGLPYYFGTRRYVLGRTDGTHNFQRDDRMSRRHAALQFREGDYWLEDLGSQNGTFLRIRGPRVLARGDVVMMGDQYFKYV